MRIEDASRPELLTVLRSLLQERDELQRKLDALADAHDRLGREHAMVEREHAIVSHLYVAGRLLHRSLDRGQVLTAILEICINLVGSEEVALFAHDVAARRLDLIASFGVDEVAYSALSVDVGAIGEAARSGVLQLGTFDDAGATDGRPAVCVPLRVTDEVVAVLVLFRLLPHKPGFEQVDYALFDLMSEQAGVALAATAEAR